MLREALMMALWMLRSSQDKPKHPTTITNPSVMDMLEDPDYLVRMIRTYTPVYDETEMKETVFANLSRLSGQTMTSERELLQVLRNLPDPDPDMVAARPL